MRHMKYFVVGLFCLMFTPALLFGEARIWEQQEVIPTYQHAPADTTPRFYDGRTTQGAKAFVYPYPMWDVLGTEKVDREYTLVYLENDYVKVSIMPRIGGRLFTALDKTNGYDYIYRQTVIKPGLIGPLGIWISGGIEWNFPHHHRPTTFMPVEYKLLENADGSVTLWTAETERRHGLRLCMTFTLYPDKSYIEVGVNPFNTSPLVQSFLYFANPAVHVDDTYQVIFPPNVEWTTGHSKFRFTKWPIDENGVDISWWKNSNGSYFAWNYETDYFAGYNHGKKAGVAYVANHHVAPGMKFFTWGHDEAARMWDHILSDNDGPYLELMAGAWSDNQPDYSWIQPYESKQVKQYWFPIRRLEGMKYANLNGAMNLSLTADGKAQVRVNTTSRYTGARVVLAVNDTAHFDEVVDIDPATPFAADVPVPRGTRETDLQASLYGADGALLLQYAPQTRRNEPRPEPVVPPPAPEEIQTVEELYLTGLRLDQFYNPSRDPLRYYEEALRRDAGNYLVNTQLGILSCRDKNWEKAEQYLRTALERITANYTMPRDGAAFYYLGLALQAQGKLKEAYDWFYKATWSQAEHSAAYFALAEIDCRRGDLEKARTHIERSIKTNGANLKALNLRAVVLRRLGAAKEATEQVRAILAASPMEYQALNELAIQQAPGEAQRTKVELKRLMRGDAQIYLNLAVDYGNAGFYDEAIDVLEQLADEPKAEGSRHPMVHYYLGYYESCKGDEDASRMHYQQAGALPSDYCFPFRPESIDVLQSASAMNPGDAMAHYYLGNLLFDSMPERAQAEWEPARSINDQIAMVHRNLALTYEQSERDIAKATASMERAIECDPSNPRLFYEMDVLYEKNRTPVSKRLALVRAHEDVIVQRTDALTRKVLVNVQGGAFDEALDTLRRYQFARWEGGGQSVRALYQDACLLQGIKEYTAGRRTEVLRDFEAALDLPQYMQMSGRGGDQRQAQVLYYIGVAYERLGNKEKAREYFQRAGEVEIRPSRFRPSPPVEHLFYQGLAFHKLGNMAAADQPFDQLVELASGNTASQPGRNRRQSDFFAKFSEEGLLNVEEAEQEFRLGLSAFVKGDVSEAEQHFRRALENDPNHYWARAHLESIQSDLHSLTL